MVLFLQDSILREAASACAAPGFPEDLEEGPPAVAAQARVQPAILF